jgi:hypothetical protein
VLPAVVAAVVLVMAGELVAALPPVVPPLRSAASASRSFASSASISLLAPVLALVLVLVLVVSPLVVSVALAIDAVFARLLVVPGVLLRELPPLRSERSVRRSEARSDTPALDDDAFCTDAGWELLVSSVLPAPLPLLFSDHREARRSFDTGLTVDPVTVVPGMTVVTAEAAAASAVVVEAAV